MALATPRNIVGYEETADPTDLTFKIDNSTITYDATKARGAATTMLDKAVTLSADDTVALAADGDAVVGKLISVEGDNKCSVRVLGFVTLPAGASATVTRGKKIVGALGASSAKGYIRDVVVAAGTYAASEANEAQKARGLIIDVGTTTAVGVILGA
jgi:hypothetical protein